MAFFLDEAVEFAAKKHSGQFRIGGSEYITHPIAVANYLKEKGLPSSYQLAGLFHDLLEDTDATEDEIISHSNEEVYRSVVLLTKRKGYEIESYLGAIRDNPMALSVKIADRIHNLHSAKIAPLAFRMKYIAESLDHYKLLAIFSPFYQDFKAALDTLHQTITGAYYCYICKEWHDILSVKMHFIRDNFPLCGNAFDQYEISIRDYERYLNREE